MRAGKQVKPALSLLVWPAGRLFCVGRRRRTSSKVVNLEHVFRKPYRPLRSYPHHNSLGQCRGLSPTKGTAGREIQLSRGR